MAAAKSRAAPDTRGRRRRTMKRQAFNRSISIPAGAAMMALTAVGAVRAQNLSDLVGMNTERAHQILASRGYQQMRMGPGSSGNRYFWWNGARAGCVAISGYYGRVARVDVASPVQCGISPGPSAGYGDRSEEHTSELLS